MISLLVYAVASFGFAYIVGHSKISLPMRQMIDPGAPTVEMTGGKVARGVFLMLLECPACLGFWTGLFAALFLNVWPDVSHLGSPLACALFTSGSNLLLSKLGGLLDE